MSTQAVEPASAVFLPGSPLPPNVRPDLAYTVPVSLASPSGFAAASYTVPGANYMRLLAFYVLFTTDATVGTRSPYLTLQDESGGDLLLIQAPAGQGATVATSYTWAYTLSAASGTIGQAQSSPWPDVLLRPGWSIVLDRGHTSTTDTLTKIMFVATFVPTGPQLSVAPVPLTPTPLIA
jgi:hypothetical protein